jgi:hypothetical protein
MWKRRCGRSSPAGWAESTATTPSARQGGQSPRHLPIPPRAARQATRDGLRPLPALSQLRLDIRQCLHDIEHTLHDVGQSLTDIEQSLLDIEQSLPDIGRWSLDIGRRSLDVEQVLLDIRQSLNDVEQGLPEIEQRLPDVGQGLPDVERNLPELASGAQRAPERPESRARQGIAAVAPLSVTPCR